jgi:predicted nucleic acid-binding Zn ribbon protein
VQNIGVAEARKDRATVLAMVLIAALVAMVAMWLH